jgi:hypothetical protein
VGFILNVWSQRINQHNFQGDEAKSIITGALKISSKYSWKKIYIGGNCIVFQTFHGINWRFDGRKLNLLAMR